MDGKMIAQLTFSENGPPKFNFKRQLTPNLIGQKEKGPAVTGDDSFDGLGGTPAYKLQTSGEWGKHQ
eukprot:4975757-Ditylum_brightwellii.AAC.1